MMKLLCEFPHWFFIFSWISLPLDESSNVCVTKFTEISSVPGYKEIEIVKKKLKFDNNYKYTL